VSAVETILWACLGGIVLWIGAALLLHQYT
jgi:hypothetical protein